MKDEDLQEWNILIVLNYEDGADSRDEFQVRAQSARGAVIKAGNRLKQDPRMEGWKIKSMWRLDPATSPATRWHA